VIDYIDLNFGGSPRVIATAIIAGRGGVSLIDPGPTSCLATLEAGLVSRGLRLRDVKNLLLTHIHLDHAASAGAIVERMPHVKVYVHELGAPHMIDPARLLASATRLFGDQMDRLWGAFLSVPPGNVMALKGGERLDLGGTSLKVIYTPGHAKHHVSYLDERTGVAYIGDVGGVRISGDHIIAPTPPPDIDVEAWTASLDAIEAWQPASLFIAHFAGATPAKAHISRMRLALKRSGDFARILLAEPGTDDTRMAKYAGWLREETQKALPPQDAAAAELAGSFDQFWQGIARYWIKKQTSEK
jgi:glyoxylase-like metal-dependent hydrolase (beta-lactamase superfamily II)